jgi:hypothetical protein
MNVKELIEHLSTFNPELEVCNTMSIADMNGPAATSPILGFEEIAAYKYNDLYLKENMKTRQLDGSYTDLRDKRTFILVAKRF